jgi:hypothetical protein
MLRSKSSALVIGVGTALALLAGTATASADTDVLSLGEQAKMRVLKDNKALHRDAPGPVGHRYSYATTSARWSVLSTDPSYYLDTTLQLFDDKSMTQLLGQSDYGSWQVEFLAVDSTHRALDTVYPRVTSPHKYYDYNIEQVQGFSTVLNGSYAIPMGTDTATVRDTLMMAGETYRFTLIPGQYMQGSMFIMGSDSSQPSTWVRSRAQSLKHGTAEINQPVVFDFTAPRTDIYGLVIVNENSEGTFTLIRAPLS